MADDLLKREEKGLLRGLHAANPPIDFCSNDYLGFALSASLRKMVGAEEKKIKMANGSGGSRLLSGNHPDTVKLEEYLATFHNAPAALLFNSGYDANLGLFGSVPSRNDTVIYDEAIHASVRDGMRLSRAQCFPFRHNDIGNLNERLAIAKGDAFIAVESVYSMDGDYAPLAELAALCSKRHAHLIVDEAHATGVFYKGLVQKSGLEEKVFARVHTFGKALGCHGAAVTGSATLKDFLINHARSFIYTTALPIHSIITIRNAYRLLEQSAAAIEKLHKLISYFRKKTADTAQTGRFASGDWQWLNSTTPIQSLIVPGTGNVKQLSAALREKGIHAPPILSPTVPRDRERLRICLHVYNSETEIDKLLDIISRQAMER